MSSVTLPRCASAPFDEEGDIILRTTDGVDFHVYRIVLVLASPWFRSMFSLQQPVPASDLAPSAPIIEVSEDAETWDCLLRYCYPIPDPVIGSLELLEKTLEAALKYELLEATSICRAQIPAYISARPLRTYAMCWRLHLEHEAAQAAEGWRDFLRTQARPATPPPFPKTRTGMSWIPEMENLPSEAYQRLIQLVAGNTVPRFCGSAPGSGSRGTEEKWSPERISHTYPFDLPDTDITLRSADGVDFPAHRLIVSLNTRPAPETSSLLDAKPLVDPPESKREVLQTDLDSSVLGSLLQLIYPSRPDEDIADWPVERLVADISAGVLTASKRCGLHHVQQQYESQWERCLHADASLLFRVASRSGLKQRARAAADYLAATRTTVDMLHVDTTGLTAGEYYRLLRYVHNHQQSVSSIVVQFFKEADNEYTGFEDEDQMPRWLAVIDSHGEQAAFTAALVAYEGRRAWHIANEGYSTYGADPMEIAGRAQDLQDRIKQALANNEVEL